MNTGELLETYPHEVHVNYASMRHLGVCSGVVKWLGAFGGVWVVSVGIIGASVSTSNVLNLSLPKTHNLKLLIF